MKKNKEVTIYDIANKLNLSPATVSRALKDEPIVNKKTKKRIFDMAEKIGYRTNNFARNLRNQKTDTIGVIIPRVNSYFMSAVIAGIERVVKSEGYTLIISQSSEAEQNEAASALAMFNNRVDGLLVSLAYDTKSLSHFEPFLKRNIPVVFFDRVIQSTNSYSIFIDNHKAAYEATQHLIMQGCRRIVHITAESELDVYTNRIKGYRQALTDHDLSFKEDRVLKGNLSLEYGKQAAEAILKMKPRPDGVFMANDNCAVGCMMTLKENGIRIPEDIAVVGFNNDQVAQVIEPNLTTVEYPGIKMGEMAAHQLINKLCLLKDVAKSYGAEVEVFHVETTVVPTVEEKQWPDTHVKIEASLAGVAHLYKDVAGRSITESIALELMSYGADMLAVVPQKAGLWNHIAKRSITRKLALEVPVPLLVLPNEYIVREPAVE